MSFCKNKWFTKFPGKVLSTQMCEILQCVKFYKIKIQLNPSNWRYAVINTLLLTCLKKWRANLAQSIPGFVCLFVGFVPIEIFFYSLPVNGSNFWLRGWDSNTQPSFCEANALSHCATAAVHSWVKGGIACSSERPRHFPKRYNYDIVKVLWRNWKIFSWTSEPILTKPDTLGEGDSIIFFYK